MTAVAQITSKQTGAILYSLNQVEENKDAIIAAIPSLADEPLIELRMQAKVLGRAAWEIECAADAEILTRESRRRGRGVKDEDGAGVEAAVRKHAAAIGVTPRTIYRNAEIHRTFFNTDSAVRNKDQNGPTDILDEKEFYNAAKASDDPHATLEYFAQQKTENPFYSTRDAWRYVKELKCPPIDSPVPPLIEDPTVKAWYDNFIRIAREAPRGVNRILSHAVEEVRDYVQRASGDRLTQVLNLIREGTDEQDLIAVETCVDRIHVAVWLNRMMDEGLIASFDKPRSPGARGAARTGHRLTDLGIASLRKK